MKQYDSYMIFGCHFPKSAISLITANSSLKYFNEKIRQTYGCEIVELFVPINEKDSIKQYFVRIIVEQSDPSIIKYNLIKDIDLTKYKDLLGIFELDNKEPYIIAVPIVRELPNYE